MKHQKKFQKKKPNTLNPNIKLKKKYGQNFLQNTEIINYITNYFNLENKTVFEIGAGAGALTEKILEQPIKILYSVEIDSEWANFLNKKYTLNQKFKLLNQDILNFKFSSLEQTEKLILIANIPYYITFPILKLLQANLNYISEGIIMIQEEVAQKLTKTSGRGYGFISLFFQHYFDFKLLKKLPPTDFFPAPKIFSRLLYLKPKENIEFIKNEPKFWSFIKNCFLYPRRTLQNNLKGANFNLNLLPATTASKRAQELSKIDFLTIWEVLSKL